MRDSAKKRLSKTANGKALIEIIEFAGGRGAFIRATGYKQQYLENWYKRGQISQEAAQEIAKMPFFADAGWTRERILPGVGIYQWRSDK